MTRWVGVLFAVALGVWGRAAQAQPTMGFIISGDCRDPDLSQNARQLARELKARLGAQLVADDGVRSRLSPQPTVNADDLGRQLDAAETLFYTGEYAKSEAAILHALEEIRRFPPGPERWKLAVRAQLLKSQVIRRLGRIAEADELFRQVLRLQPSYQLDPDYFMPSIRQRFDRLRKELQATRRVRVDVKSLPAGAEIFLDGVKQGTTPAALEVWPGDYELAVVRDGQRSLPHQLAAHLENAILVDLQFEGAIQLDRDPCFATRPGDEHTRLAGALRIATLLGVDAMVVLQLERPKTGPGSLVAMVLDTQTAQVKRYGGIKLQGGTQQPPAALAELAKLMIAGESGKPLVAVDGVKPPPAPPDVVPASTASNPAPALLPRPPAVASTAAPASAEAPGWLPKGWRGDAVLGFGCAGAGAAVVGGILLAVGEGTMEEANRYVIGGLHGSAVATVSELQDTAQLERGVGVAGLIAGGLGLVTAGALWSVDPFAPVPVKGPSLSVGASRGGASVQLSGRF